MAKISTVDFNNKGIEQLKSMKYGKDWPVVYILNNDEEAYVGETLDASIRANQHLANDVRRHLKKMNIISDKTFNKSAILDLESFLIKYMSADDLYKLQNGNQGLKNHNYYERKMYEKKFKEIWVQLRSKGLVKNDLRIIENSDLFKYSPYKALTTEQYMIVNNVLSDLSEHIKKNEKASFIVEGGAGTGKTILGIYLMKLLSEVKNEKVIIEDNEIDDTLSEIVEFHNSIDKLKIALVIPMDNLRTTLKKVFKNIKGLNSNMVISPNDVAKYEDTYDLLIIDEAHRLRQRKNLTQYGTFDKNNQMLGLDKNGTEFDWIMEKSSYQIFFYDEDQSIKPTDISKEKMNTLLKGAYFHKNIVHKYGLETQLRCLKGGEEYVQYIKAVFSNNPPSKIHKFRDYDLKLFDNVNEMIEEIKTKNEEYGLCRNIAGYAWKWNTKGKKLPMHSNLNEVNKAMQNGIYDIEIDGYRYIWNTKATDWINSPNSINEIGSIHTTQGFDLNYTGLIIGNELKYDKENNKLIVDRKNYYDAKGKDATDDKELLQYILNIYQTMCLRGMLGTYIYVCDSNLKEYLEKYIRK